jgi:hypothetical protein
MNRKNTNECEREKFLLYFYYGLAPWYTNSLDFASGGSFVLASSEEISTANKNLFGIKIEENEEFEYINTILTSKRKDLRIMLKGYRVK